MKILLPLFLLGLSGWTAAYRTGNLLRFDCVFVCVCVCQDEIHLLSECCWSVIIIKVRSHCSSMKLWTAAEKIIFWLYYWVLYQILSHIHRSVWIFKGSYSKPVVHWYIQHGPIVHISQALLCNQRKRDQWTLWALIWHCCHPASNVSPLLHGAVGQQIHHTCEP